MKKFLIISLLIISFSSNHLLAEEIRAYLSYAVFLSPDQGTYIETYLSVIGNTVEFAKNDKGKYQGTIEISLQFKQGDEIKAIKKYNLLSPEINDTINGRTNFIDQQRISLANGVYDFEIQIVDKNKVGEKSFISNRPLVIDFSPNQINISDIELLESYTKSTSQNILTKSGYDLIPYVSNFYPENLNKINFYTEIYNAENILGKDEKIVLNYYIESYETKVKMNNYSSFSKQTANNVNILLAEFSIGELPSGNYNLVIEVKDKLNQSLAIKKAFLQRKNPTIQLSLNDIASLNTVNSFVDRIKSKDTLTNFIRSLRPISSQLERTFAENQLKGNDIQLMQQYLLNFWKNRNLTNPEQAWLNYCQEVKKVNIAFKSQVLKGYDTDRGRVYLQYGPPDQRIKSPMEPLAYPYEIWQYYKLQGQTNRMFVFYERDRGSDNYRLLHSDAKGEIYDRNWEIRLNHRDNLPNNLDQQESPDHIGGRSSDEFNFPK